MRETTIYAAGTARPTGLRGRVWRTTAALLGLATLMMAPARAAPPTAAQLFREPAFSQGQLSPDGQKVAVLVSGGAEARRSLVVVDLETLKPVVVGSFKGRDVDWHQWVNDNRLVFRLNWELVGPGRAAEGPGLYAANADGESFRALVANSRSFLSNSDEGNLLDAHTGVYHVSGLSADGSIVVGRPREVSRERVGYHELLSLNTNSGRTTDVASPVRATHWVFGAGNLPVAALSEVDGKAAWDLHQRDGSWKRLREFDPLADGGVSPVWQAPDGRLFGTGTFKGFRALYTLDPASGEPAAQPLLAVDGFDLSQPQFVVHGQKLLGVRFMADALATHWFDDDARAVQQELDRRLPGTANHLQFPRHGASPWVLVTAVSDAQPASTLAYNRQTRRLVRVGTTLPGLDPQALGRTRFERVPARDGLPIPVYLTLPPGGGTKLPLVVLVHGGPWARGANWAFSPEVQFLASRGYAVLQPEFRGSTGFGDRHFRASFGEWGRAMQDDVTDATRWAIAQGVADPARVCIAGASYGGYATLMGLVREPALYRCGIDWVGVTDPDLLFSVGWSDMTEESRRYGLARMVGDPVRDALRLRQVSPLHMAGSITQPLLMAYGGWDRRVPLVHGEKLRDALRQAGHQPEWVVYPEEGHGWERVETRIDFWTRVEAFLAKHLSANPAR